MVKATYVSNGQAGVGEAGTVEAFILDAGRVVSAWALKQQAIGGAWPPAAGSLRLGPQRTDAQGNVFFGIKADTSWAGAVYSGTTREFEGGV